MDLEFTITNQKMVRDDEERPVNLSQNYYNLIFDFTTSDWDNTTKYALFKVDGSTYLRELTNDTVVTPGVSLLNGVFELSVFGATDEYRITSNVVKIYLIRSNYTEELSSHTVPYEGDVVKNIYEILDEKVDIEDIIDYLVSTDSDKPLSANQGKVLKDLVDSKFDSYVTYTKTEVDGFLNLKADKSSVYTQNQLDSMLVLKADADTVYTKTETDNFLDDKSDVGHTHDTRYYTESEVDDLLEGKSSTGHTHDLNKF